MPSDNEMPQKAHISKQCAVGDTTSQICRAMLALIACVSFLCFSSDLANAQSNQASPLGTNLLGITYSSTEQPFLNIFKTGMGWSTRNSSNVDTGEEVALYQKFLDANGYPTTIAPDGYNFTRVAALLLRNVIPYPAGTYVFLYDGTGTFAFTDDFSVQSATPGRIVLSAAPSGAGTFVYLLTTGTGAAHATNFRLVYSPDSTADVVGTREALLNGGEIFNPDFINQIAPFKTLRFMNWMATLNNFQKNWSDRPLAGWAFYADSRTNAAINGNSPSQDFGGMNDGVPAEVMFALCNKIGADCWFNMPPLASDDYVTQFAMLAHSTLNSNLKVYVEYANELWNQVLGPSSGAMTQTVVQQVSALCVAAYPSMASGFSDYQKNTQYGALRAVQVGALWKTAWGTDAGRVVRLFGGWNGNNGYNSFWLPWTDSHFTGTLASNVDALAVAPYFGYPVPDTFTLDQFFTEMMSGGLVTSGGYPGGMVKQVLDWVASNYATAKTYGLPLVAYEGGQTLVDFSHSDTALQNLYAAANRDPRMGTAYTTFLNGWKSIGGTLFNHFNDVGAYTTWGFWGALENILQTNSPKYDALINFISANPCWWSGCTTSTTSGSTTSGSSTSGSTTSGSTTSGSTTSGSTTSGSTTSGSTTSGSSTSGSTTSGSTTSGSTTSGSTTSGSTSTTPTTPPTVALASPGNGAVYKANGAVNIAASARDPSGVASITIGTDSGTLMICANATSCSATWQGKKISQGTHTISATAVNKLGLPASTSITIVELK